MTRIGKEHGDASDGGHLDEAGDDGDGDEDDGDGDEDDGGGDGVEHCCDSEFVFCFLHP